MKPLRLVRGRPWQDWATCTAPGVDPALFDEFTQRGVRAATDPRIQAALAICAQCPVWKQCVYTRANYTDTEQFIAVGVYGRQYVDVNEARRRRKRAKAREQRLTNRETGTVRRLVVAMRDEQRLSFGVIAERLSLSVTMARTRYTEGKNAA